MLNLLTALSLLLCLAVVALWAMSIRSPDLLYWELAPVGTNERWASIRDGRGMFATAAAWPDIRDPAWGQTYQVWQFGVGYGGGRILRLYDGGLSAGVYYRWRGVHLSLIVLLLAVAPVWSLARYCHKRLSTGRRSATCGSCGYDLRATPHRCPECGRTAAMTP
jgi:hypothetical protein